ncbi:MAG: DUF255 domain-containing protein [Thermoanaerobacterales bacterium]|nr:DUF255 domain-containing protein [Thermoanaerobacterales bacterium]
MAEQRFHFSPRPNRAHEINWREWGDAPFAEALVERKLVLLSISGVWCHWCHVMDETSYSDPEIIFLVNERFIPVRVDTDQRPDVNARYNLGGWPTTAILTPEGRLVTGGTYMPPDELRPLLEKASRLFAEEPEAFRSDEPILRGPELAVTEELTLEFYEGVAGRLRRAFDRRYGGFGRAPKFPMVEALEMALNLYYHGSREDDLEMASFSLKVMAGGGMYDPVEGGFFRYSTSRDWLIPHYEKMLEDNAGLLGVLALTYQVTGDVHFLDVARDVMRYLEENLHLPDSRCWAGSQDADEGYYMRDLPERRRMGRPYIDRRIYTDFNALLVRSLCQLAWVTGEGRWQEMALATLNALWRRAYREGQGMGHVIDDKGLVSLVGRLEDQVATGRACLAAYQGTGDGVWLERSRALAAVCRARLRAPNGGFYDIPPDPGAPGALAVPLVDFQSNARAARWLVEQSALTGTEDDRREAVAAVKTALAGGREAGIHAAGLALAVYECLAPATTVRVVGRPGKETAALHRAALAAYRPGKAVRLLEAGRHDEALREAGYAAGAKPQAYVCIGRHCLAPVGGPAELVDLLQRAQAPDAKGAPGDPATAPG